MEIIKNKRMIKPSMVIVLIFSLVFMWSIIGASLPTGEISTQLNQIEESIMKDDWNQAKMSMEDLKTIYNSNKVLVQGSNSNEVISTLDYILAELKNSIDNEQDTALGYIRGLKASLEY